MRSSLLYPKVFDQLCSSKILHHQWSLCRSPYSEPLEILAVLASFYSFFHPFIHESTSEYFADSKHAKLSRNNLNSHGCCTGYNLRSSAMSRYRTVATGSTFCTGLAFMRRFGVRYYGIRKWAAFRWNSPATFCVFLRP